MLRLFDARFLTVTIRIAVSGFGAVGGDRFEPYLLIGV